MPNASCITFTEPTSTVAYSWCPVEASAGKTVLIHRHTEGTTWDSTIILTYSNASAQRSTHKATISIALPLGYTDSEGNTQIVTARFVNGQYIIPGELADFSRTMFANIVEAILTDPLVRNYYESLDPMY